jgi:hypothetical protein
MSVTLVTSHVDKSLLNIDDSNAAKANTNDNPRKVNAKNIASDPQ